MTEVGVNDDLEDEADEVDAAVPISVEVKLQSIHILPVQYVYFSIFYILMK
jgi:hypothetical protein